MSSFLSRAGRWTLVLPAAALVGACQEPVAVGDRPTPFTDVAVNFPQAGAAVAWNQVARDLVAEYRTSVPASIRMFALLSVAQYNAIVHAEKESAGSLHPSDAGAVAGASAAVLSYIYPLEAAFLEGLVNQQKASPGSPGSVHKDLAAGEAIGRAVADGLIARAQTDRFFEPFTGTVPVCPGCWLPVPTPPAFATLGQAKTFFLTSGDQFRPPPPPAFGTPSFVAALAEVRQIADTRTAEQDSIAKFWALPAGTIGAQGYFNRVGSELAVKYRLTERETAHALALLNMAAFDAIIASHEAKYFYWSIRPSQADPLIVRAIGLPSFPSYPSNHSTLAAAAATVLGATFPSERARLDAMAGEGAISRLFGGIHYRFDTEAGLALGSKVGAWVLSHDVVGHEPFVLQ
jgi:membrane-associated phospholipid phosphatase